MCEFCSVLASNTEGLEFPAGITNKNFFRLPGTNIDKTQFLNKFEIIMKPAVEKNKTRIYLGPGKVPAPRKKKKFWKN